MLWVPLLRLRVALAVVNTVVVEVCRMSRAQSLWKLGLFLFSFSCFFRRVGIVVDGIELILFSEAVRRRRQWESAVVTAEFWSFACRAESVSEVLSRVSRRLGLSEGLVVGRYLRLAIASC